VSCLHGATGLSISTLHSVTSVAIQATGVRFDEVDAGQLSSPSPEQRAEHVAWERGDLVFVTATAFVAFTDDRGEQRWMGTPQGPYGVPLEVDATSLLLDLVERPDDLLPDLGISDLKSAALTSTPPRDASSSPTISAAGCCSANANSHPARRRGYRTAVYK
jgi:hypothetical protein